MLTLGAVGVGWAAHVYLRDRDEDYGTSYVPPPSNDEPLPVLEVPEDNWLSEPVVGPFIDLQLGREYQSVLTNVPQGVVLQHKSDVGVTLEEDAGSALVRIVPRQPAVGVITLKKIEDGTVTWQRLLPYRILEETTV